MNKQLSEQNQTDEKEKLDSQMKRLDLKILNRSKERENFWLGPTKWKSTGEVRYTLPKWKILRYASEKYYRIHTCKAKTST